MAAEKAVSGVRVSDMKEVRLYYEQDGYETTLHNYCTGRPGYSVTADTKCVIRKK